MPAFRPLLDRFIEKFELDPDTGCWNWTGSISRTGYGRIQNQGRLIESHRISYLIFNGEITDGLEVNHICRNRRCVNPNHLNLLTHWENTDHDRRKTACDHGHPYLPGSYYVYKTKYGTGRWCKQCARIRNAKHLGIPLEIVGTREKPRERTKCPKGHELSEVGVIERMRNGRKDRMCKLCTKLRNERNAKHRREVRAAKKLATPTNPL